MEIQIEKEILFKSKNIKIELDEFKLKLYENNNFLIESKKNYFGNVKLIYDNKRENFYVLDSDKSCIDIYVKDNFEYKKSIGEKFYWKDFIHKNKFDFFLLGKESFKKSLILFYPLDFQLHNDYLYIWDSRNFLIYKIDLESFKVIKIKKLNIELKKVFFDENNIFYEFDNETIKEEYDNDFVDFIDYIKFFIECPYKDILDLEKKYLMEIQDQNNIKSDVYKKYREEIFNYSLLNIKNYEYLELSNIYKVPLNYGLFEYNKNMDSYIFLRRNSKTKEYLKIFSTSENKIFSFKDNNGIFEKPWDLIAHKEYFYVLDSGNNRIYKISKNFNIEIIKVLESKLDKYNFIYNFEDDVYVSALKENSVLKINLSDEKIEEELKNEIKDFFHLYINDNDCFKTIFPESDLYRKGNIYFNQNSIEGINIFRTDKIIKIKNYLLLFMPFLSKIDFFNLDTKSIEFSQVISPEINRIIKISDETIAGYSAYSGKLYEFNININQK